MKRVSRTSRGDGIVTVSEHRSLNESLLTTISGLRLRCSCRRQGPNRPRPHHRIERPTLQHLLANRRGKRVFYRTVDIRTLLIPFKELRKVGDRNTSMLGQDGDSISIFARIGAKRANLHPGTSPLQHHKRPPRGISLPRELAKAVLSLRKRISLALKLNRNTIRPPSQSKRNLARFYQNSLFLPQNSHSSEAREPLSATGRCRWVQPLP